MSINLIVVILYLLGYIFNLI